MATKRLYPPVVEGTIPAFYGNTITVPYTMNRAVGAMEVAGFVLKMRTVSGDLKEVVTLELESFQADQQYITFPLDLKNNIYTVGEFYKVQLAYKSIDGTVGYFSTVAVVKYTTRPTVYIDGLSDRFSNANTFNYVGVYDQGESGDITEKLYSSEFIIYDENEEIVARSGNILHNTAVDDTPSTQYENFRFTSDLSASKNYYIIYKTVSVNNLETQSPRYRLIQQRAISPEIDVELQAELNYEQGYIRLFFNPDSLKTKIISGKFLIIRKDTNKTDEWEELKFFAAESLEADKWEFKDFTIEHGIDYQYALQQYNSHGIYSSKIMANKSTPIKADFEDMFLFDGQRQLNIRFNPEVSTFKNTILESKVETIGSKYPFISRNGNVNYKQFPINGLISYYMDEEELFVTKEEIDCDAATTGYTSENIFSERMFKLKVLEWLTDGKPKLFKSPAEGNYIVQLMNVTLTPEKVTGRMIHRFQCQASQVADTTAEALDELQIIRKQAEEPEKLYQWMTATIEDILEDHPISGHVEEWYIRELAKLDKTLPTYADDKQALDELYREKQIDANRGERWYKINKDPIYSINITDMNPGDQFMIDNKVVQIGITGAYEFISDVPIQELKVRLVPQIGYGFITYSIQAQNRGLFDLTKSVYIEEVAARQLYGDGVTNYLLRYSDTNFQNIDDYQERLSNPEEEIVSIQQIRFFKKDIQPLTIKSTSTNSIVSASEKLVLKDGQPVIVDGSGQEVASRAFYSTNTSYAVSVLDSNFKSNEAATIYLSEDDNSYMNDNSEKKFVLSKLPSNVIYPIYNDMNSEKTYTGTVLYFDKYYSDEIKLIEVPNLEDFQVQLFSAFINNVRIEVDEMEIYKADNITGVYLLTINPGVIGEVSYIRAVTTFDLEDTNLETMRKNKNVLLEELKANVGIEPLDEIIQRDKKYHLARNSYLGYLKSILINYKQERGIPLS